MDGPYRLVIEDPPDPADVAFLEQCVADAAGTAAGVGAEQEFGASSATTMGGCWRVSRASSGVGTASCRRCGSTKGTVAGGWREP
jgi:hypothetical protein